MELFNTAFFKSSFDLSGPLKIILFPGTLLARAFSYSKPDTTSAQDPS